MDRESTSFWSDIKKYEDTLAKDPKSYCFAPLSELYRKLGLLDDAIITAKRGVDVHPEYIGGYMALGRAYFEKGMRPEARESLEKVAKATPENLLAQKLLSHIYQEEGDVIAAERALRTLITFNPEDTESRLALEALQRSRVATGAAEQESPPPVPSLEEPTATAATGDAASATEWADAFLMPASNASPVGEEEEEQAFTFEEWEEAPETEVATAAQSYAPLPTMTLAELFATQGLREKALDVYNQLLDRDPDNQEVKERIEALRRDIEDEKARDSKVPYVGELERTCDEIPPEVLAEPVETGLGGVADNSPGMTHESVVLETLEKWLYSIRRERECRSGKF